MSANNIFIFTVERTKGFKILINFAHNTSRNGLFLFSLLSEVLQQTLPKKRGKTTTCYCFFFPINFWRMFFPLFLLCDGPPFFPAVPFLSVVRCARPPFLSASPPACCCCCCFSAILFRLASRLALRSALSSRFTFAASLTYSFFNSSGIEIDTKLLDRKNTNARNEINDDDEEVVAGWRTMPSRSFGVR